MNWYLIFVNLLLFLQFSKKSICFHRNLTVKTLPSKTVNFLRIIQDQEKINSQQKSLREQEQERQWKQLQAMRAREQQMQQMQHIVIHDQKNQGNKKYEHFKCKNCRFKKKFILFLKFCYTVDPSTQLQISTNCNDGLGPMASPSPNSRSAGQFVQPSSKARIIVGLQGPQQNQANFQHPAMSRPVSVQIPRQGQMQQRALGQSPFSPQSQPPQSPHEQFPLSPATQNGIDPFSRPPSENSQQDPYLNVSFVYLLLAEMK